MKKIKRAMVLSAGLGTRLLPLTETLPKPLLPVLNLPNIVHTLFWLKMHGVEEVIFNLYHLHEQLESFLTGFKKWDLKISISKETILLGTGGGVKKAERFFKGEPFLVCNCDFICDFDLSVPISNFLENEALASMILLEDSQKQKLYSQVGVTSNNDLCLLPKLKTGEPERTGLFTGIHLLRPEALLPLKEEPSGINEILYPYFMKKTPERIKGIFAKGLWLDTGERKTYLEANLVLLKNLPPLTQRLLEEFGYKRVSTNWQKQNSPAFASHSLLAENTQAAEISNCVIGDKVAIANEVSLKDCVVLPNTNVNQSHEKKILSGPHVLSSTQK